MVRRIQQTPIVPKPQPRPWSTVEKKRDAQCRECGRIYLNTKRTLCPKCDSFTVEEICR